MISMKIVDTDAFLDMPLSSQSLYFHLLMRADDDGFVANPKKIARMLGTSEDDYKVIIAKHFVIPFESGVCVIKHWLIHNLVRADRYTETQWIKEKEMLVVDEQTKKYSLNKGRKDVIPNGNHLAPQVRLGKVRLGKVNTGKEAAHSAAGESSQKFTTLGAEVLKSFEEVDAKNKQYYGNTTQRKAADFLIEEYGLGEVLKRISVLPKTNKMPYFPTITTPVQLRDKWMQLQDAVERKRAESNKNQLII